MGRSFCHAVIESSSSRISDSMSPVNVAVIETLTSLPLVSSVGAPSGRVPLSVTLIEVTSVEPQRPTRAPYCPVGCAGRDLDLRGDLGKVVPRKGERHLSCWVLGDVHPIPVTLRGVERQTG